MRSPHLSGDERKLQKGIPEDYSSGLPSFLPTLPLCCIELIQSQQQRSLGSRSRSERGRCDGIVQSLQSAVIALCYHHYRLPPAGTVLVVHSPTFRLLDLSTCRLAGSLVLWLVLVGVSPIGWLQASIRGLVASAAGTVLVRGRLPTCQLVDLLACREVGGASRRRWVVRCRVWSPAGGAASGWGVGAGDCIVQ